MNVLSFESISWLSNLHLGSSAICLTLGVAFHLAIQKFDLDYYIHYFLAGCTAVWAILIVTYVAFAQIDYQSAIHLSCVNAIIFALGLIISIATYRLFLHRLNHFPGPCGAAISRFYLVSCIFRSLQYHILLDDWHRRYGDFVRTGPREISVNRLSAVRVVHGPSSRCVKAPWYAHVSNDPTKVSLHMTRDPEVHRRRRRAVDRGFSKKALESYEPLITSKTNILISQTRHRVSHAGYINMSEWIAFLSFDLMGLIAFGKDFNQLESAVEHVAIQRLHATLDLVGRLAPVPWLLGLLTSIPKLSGSYIEFINYCWVQVEEKKKRWLSKSDQVPADIISWLLQAIGKKDASAPPGDQALHEDGRLMIIAGSDTITSTIANALYYLAMHPSKYHKLQLETDKIQLPHNKDNPSISSAAFDACQVSELPYLDAVINEVLRLKPASPSGQPRVTPPEGLQIDEVRVPGNVIITVPQHSIQRDERNFADANEFRPERWINEDSEVHREAAFFPFCIGPLSCPGKRLAITEMQIVLASISRQFDLEFAPGQSRTAFDTQVKDTVTLAVPPLLLVFKERDRG